MITAQQLLDAEARYGSVHHTPCLRKSDYDDTLPLGYIMRGGDRMELHNYTPYYVEVLNKFSNVRNGVLVELGVLKGVGLATICDFVPKATTVIGLDIDIENFYGNRDALISRGAFVNLYPMVFAFDEHSPSAPGALNAILDKRKINLMIDDGLHDDRSVIRAFNMVAPHLAEDFIYVIEDNNTAREELKVQYQDFDFREANYLTIVTRKQST